MPPERLADKRSAVSVGSFEGVTKLSTQTDLSCKRLEWVGNGHLASASVPREML